jgi:hypothetical protein
VRDGGRTRLAERAFRKRRRDIRDGAEGSGESELGTAAAPADDEGGEE